MLRQRLPVRAAAASLFTAPLLGLVAACAWPPLRASQQAQIAAITTEPGRFYIFALFILLSSIMLVPAVLALMRLLGYTRPTWALLAGCLAQLGILIGIADSANELMYWQMGAPGASLSQMTALATRYNSAPGAALIFMIGGLAVISGTLLLAAGLWRARAVPAWAAIAVVASVIANIVGLSANSVPITLASFALMLAGFGRIAVVVWNSPAWDQRDRSQAAVPTADNPLPAHR
ncbi:MAG: hypothetical protein ACLQFR_27445 [Streptosporangiaceae bacterium]